jgi:hypothetical protein
VQLAVVRPCVDPYSPALQFVHTPTPPNEYFPKSQIAAVAFADPATQKCPAAHSPEQVAFVRPCVDPYSPAAQSVHTLVPPNEYFPTPQTAAVALVDPATQKYPAAQSPLQLDTAIAGVDPYRPGAQSVQTLAPVREYLPAEHIAAVAMVDPASQ